MACYNRGMIQIPHLRRWFIGNFRNQGSLSSDSIGSLPAGRLLLGGVRSLVWNWIRLKCGWNTLLMVQKSGDHQLRKVGSVSHYWQRFYTSQVNHQQHGPIARDRNLRGWKRDPPFGGINPGHGLKKLVDVKWLSGVSKFDGGYENPW